MQRRLITATGNVVLLLCLMYLITYIDRVNLSTAAPLIRKEFGLSQTQLGIAFSAFGYPYAVFQIIGGALGDHFGARRTLTLCGLIWAVATILTGLTGGLISLFLARLLLGIGEGATFPTATRAMQYWVAKDRRGWAQGVTHAFARGGKRHHSTAGGVAHAVVHLARRLRRPWPGQPDLGGGLGRLLPRRPEEPPRRDGRGGREAPCLRSRTSNAPRRGRRGGRSSGTSSR